MNTFTALPTEKQERIINASLMCFGADGYKKASINDIATSAEISKAMVFHYFGTKKGLYTYLVNMVGQLLIDAFSSVLPQILDPMLSDFFDRIRFSVKIKVALMKKHPAVLTFVNTMYSEQDPEVRPLINEVMVKGEALRKMVACGGIDSYKFKDGIDAAKIMKMLTWMVEGYLSELPTNPQYDIDELVAMFDESMEIMKKNFYKEEYL